MYDTPWAILESELTVLAARAALMFGDDQSPVAALPRGPRSAGGAVAVLPLYGVTSHRASMQSLLAGGTSIEGFTAQFRAAIGDPAVKAVVLDVNSPGGSVFGVQELAAEILASRGRKPIIAVANSMMASAAYWVASAADDITVTPSGEVGSIGVYALHLNESAALDAAGISPTLISAGRYKTEGNPFEPLNADARAAMQSRVDEYYGMFVAAVAQGRGTTPAEVRSGFGQGRVVGAREAVRLGMADRVGTLDATLARLGVSVPAGMLAQDATEAGSDIVSSVYDREVRELRARLLERI